MNDIAKMRAEFEEKIHLAELENQYGADLEKYGLRISIFSTDKETGRYLASVRKESITDKLTEQDVAVVLNTLPMTEKMNVYVGSDKYEKLSYQMDTERTPSEWRTTLKIKYIHDDLVLWIDLPINEQNEELMQYFTRTQRELDDSTIGLYYGCVSPRQKSHLKMLSFLTWNSGHVVRFNGGSHRQIAEGIVTCVASTLWGMSE